MKSKVLTLLSVFFCSVCAAAGVLANTGGRGVLGSQISVCFVGTPNATGAMFLSQVKQYLREHEGVANINYKFLASCPAPTTDGNGNDVFSGDLRVAIFDQLQDPTAVVAYSPPGFLIPGKGCSRRVPTGFDSSGNEFDTMSSFGIFPSDRAPENDSHCLWNMRLGPDGMTVDSSGNFIGTPWRNHSLHEFGHSLGFAHEFDRSDSRGASTAAGCNSSVPNAAAFVATLPGAGSGNNSYTSENYDLNATMNYTIPGCPGYVGNHSNAGLGDLEKISLHFMYPENQRVAEFLGTTVITTGETTVLRGLWEVRGAAFTVHQMITNYVWLEQGAVLSTTSSLTLSYPKPGPHNLTLFYVDYLGRTYAFNFTVRVVTPGDFAKTIAGQMAAWSPMLVQP
jgi:hypothetical protein